MKFIVAKKKTLLGAAAFALALALSIIATAHAGAADVFFGTVKRSLPIYAVGTEEKKVAISFDCAWGTEKTDRLLQIMAEENIRSTFFMVEFWTEKYPEYVKKIDEAGHEIGTHSATHPYMSKLSEEKIRMELSTSAAAIEGITGKKVELFRPPYGDYNDRLVDTAKDMGLYTVQWDVDSLDWKNLSGQEIAMRVISRVKPGSIILCHNNAEHTPEALPLIIADLKNKGYTFVPVGELIYRDGYEIAADGTQVKI